MDNSSIHHLGYPPNLHPRTTSHIIERQQPTSTNIPESTLHGDPMPRKEKKNINVGQSDMNLSQLAISCSRIPLMHGGVHYLPCSGWALVCIYIYEIK